MMFFSTALIGISGVFVAVGGIFCWHAYEVYDEARELTSNLTDLIIRLDEERKNKE